MKMRRLLLIGLACGLGTSVLLARPGVVELKDGQRIEGEIVQDNPTSVVVNIRGIRTEIARDRVAAVTYSEGFEQEYEKRLAGLQPDDAAGRVALARWAFENREYAVARRTLEDVLENVDPNSREASDLLSLVRAQIQLEQRPQGDDRNTGAEVPEGNGEEEEQPQENAAEVRYLTAADIKRIKAAEVKAREPDLRLRIPDDVRRQFLETTQMTPRQFQSLSEVEKLQALARDGTPEMTDRVEVRGDPVTMGVFRTRVQPIILNGCATSGCHNTPVGGFMLYPRAERSEPATYTNFYILQRYTHQSQQEGDDDGLFAGAGATQRMIDRTSPQSSLLLQYALPPARNRTSHPEVQGYRGLLRGTNDPRYAQILGWIRSLEAFEPDYQIDYTPPGAEAADAPAAPAQPAPQTQQPAPNAPATPATPATPAPRR